jgi:signal transduction histidine kinase
MLFARRDGRDTPLHRAEVHGAEVDPGARAEGSLVTAFIWMRCYHLGAGLVSLGVDRRRYRRPRLADAVFAVVAAESLWVFLQLRRRGAYNDARVATVDTATGCAGLVACALAVRPDDQFNAINWMFPLTLFSAVAGSAGFPRRVQSLVGGTALAATYALATGSQTSSSRRSAIFGVWQYAGCLIAGDVLLRRIRANAAATEAARQTAVERAGRVAQERERTRLHAELHAGALQTLTELRAKWHVDREGARVLARREAIRLRRALQGDDLLGADRLARRLDEVSDVVAASGLQVELVVDVLESEPSGEIADALAQAVEAALDNVVAHARVRDAVVRVTELGDDLEVTVRDRGAGAVLVEPPARVRGPVERVGGRVEVWSAPERGTRVTIRVPRRGQR